MKNLLLFFTLLAFLEGARAQQQVQGTPQAAPKFPELYHAVMQQDSLMFGAFNTKDLAGLGKYFDPGLEIFQDNAGYRNYTQTMDAFTGLFAQPYTLTRTLLPASVEIYPIKDYGAIMTGSHRFCHVENGREECATFKFVHIWKQVKDGWVVSRIVTYDH